MKTKTLIVILIGSLIVSVLSVGLFAAKSDKPGQGEKPTNPQRPFRIAYKQNPSSEPLLSMVEGSAGYNIFLHMPWPELPRLNC